jgi:peptidoglycan/xylan/chitin deacetylase (PgdA/CDA1 family)
MREVRQTGHLLTEILGDAPRWIRPPHGKLTGAMLLGLWALKQTVVLWNVDPKDFSCRSSEEVSSWFQRNPLQSGDMVLFHDKWPFAAEALPRLIAAARAMGLGFSTIDEWSQ